MPVFGNPLGLLALLGIPVVLAIHYLQRRARELPVSTLFLLERGQREAAGGRVIERLVPSVPLWMQLLAVLLLAWLLADPRFRRSGSIQRVAVVLDSSASMEVFKQQVSDRLLESLPALRGTAAELQLTVLEAVPERPRLYSGPSPSAMGKELETWEPRDGPVDPTQALRLARSLVSNEGTVVYLTDTPGGPLPFDAMRLAVGEPVENVGFTGVSFSEVDGTLVWKALVKNHGRQVAERTWRIETAAGFGEERPLRLDPGAMATLQAAFPMDSKHVRVALSPDRFTLDDVLPLVAPRPKPLRLFSAAAAEVSDLTAQLARALDAAEIAPFAGDADLVIAMSDPASPDPSAGNALLFAAAAGGEAEKPAGAVVAEDHPLVSGLNWQTLLVRGGSRLEPLPNDTVLLWTGERPLVLLRASATGKQLWCAFDPRMSNATRQPAFVVLMHRFAESVREAKVAPVAANLETGEPLEIATLPNIPITVEFNTANGSSSAVDADDIRFAPRSPGFLQVRQGDAVLLDAAVHFGDPREADFSGCGNSEFDLAEEAVANAAVARHTNPDPFWRLWVLLLIAVLLVSWKFTATTRTA